MPDLSKPSPDRKYPGVSPAANQPGRQTANPNSASFSHQSGTRPDIPPQIPGRPAVQYPATSQPPPIQPPPPARPPYPTRTPAGRRRSRRPTRRSPIPRIGCLGIGFLLVCCLLASATAIILPGQTNVLLLGIDYAEMGSFAARSDTIILTSFVPRKPAVRVLSIPRDLWVTIPGIGENRINTAHFYAESSQPGTGPQAVIDTVEANFGIRMDYYLRIKFEGFREIVDALGGVDIVLEEPMAGYEVGRHHLTGRKALAFVRDRANSDDFFRMAHGQLMLKSLYINLLNPIKWPRLPLVARAFFRSVDTNIPVWMWPRLSLMLLYTGPHGIEAQTIQREMVTPTTTDQGASVLLPNWDLIHILVRQIFQP